MLREAKSANDPAAWAAEECIQSSIKPATTELIPDLIAVVRDNPKIGWHVSSAMNQYAVWGIVNRQLSGLEYEKEFAAYLHAPELQARLIGACGMALVDQEYAGPETLRVAFQGLASPDEETRRWAGVVFRDMFQQFRYGSSGSIVSNQTDGILARVFSAEGAKSLPSARPYSEAEVQEAGRTVWAALARTCREDLKHASRDTSHVAWMQDRTCWAVTQARLGRALVEQAALTPGPEGARLLAEAAEAYRAAMEDCTREVSEPQWALYEDSLGRALSLQAERIQGPLAGRLLLESVKAHRAALEAYSPEYNPRARERVSENLRHAEALWKLKA